MLKDSIQVFQKLYEAKGDKLILDSYTPADGTYVIVEPTENSFKIKDVIDIKYDKKNKKLAGKENSNFSIICDMDYNSILIDMNKPIDKTKVIQSNNMFSFFIKKENLTSGKLTNAVIDGYYAVLKNPYLKYSNGNAKKLYQAVEEEIGAPDRALIEKINGWVKNNIFNLNIDITGKDYLKLFFKYPMEQFIKENRRYMAPNIFNKNDFNVNLEKDIYGLSNDNMGLNSKKPYLENKTRKTTVAYLVDNREVLIQKKFFDYLMNFAAVGKYNIYIDDKIEGMINGEVPKRDFQGIFLRISKGKNEAEIHDYDIITSYQYTLNKKFEFKNALNLDFTSKSFSSDYYGFHYNVEEMQNIFNDVLFSKYLINNYFTEAQDVSIKEGYLKNSLLLARNVIFDWIYKGIDNGICTVLAKVSLNLIKGSIFNGYIPKASHQFNLRWSIIDYYKGGVNMADKINDLKSSLKIKINAADTGALESDDEYYFAIGQLVSYILSKNKGKKKSHSLANPFINGKNDEIIKDKIRKYYMKYNYDIDMNGRRFKNLYAMILGYDSENKVNQDMIIAGYLSSNLIYESDKKEEKVNG